MAGRMRVPRTRGVLSGLLLIILGAWGAIIPFVGPYFHYAYTPDSTWTYTVDRLWLSVLPGAAVFLGGLIVLGSAHRAFASLGGWLAALGGAWFVVGPPLSALSGMPKTGVPTGGNTRQVLEALGFFSALGVVIVFLAAFALGRFAVVGIKEHRALEEEAAAERLATMDDERYGAGRASAAPAAETSAVGTSAAAAAEPDYYPDRGTSTVDRDPGHAEPVVGMPPAADTAQGGMPTKQTATSGWTEPAPGASAPAAGAAPPAAGGPASGPGSGPASEGGVSERGADPNPPATEQQAEPYSGWTATDADKQDWGRSAASAPPAGPQYGESAEQPTSAQRHSDWSTNAADGLPAAPPVEDDSARENEGKLHRLLHRQNH